jgi:hypothetical protein
MTDKNERIQILEMIKSGVITAEEGARLLQALEVDARLEESSDDQFHDSASDGMPGADSGSYSGTVEDEFGSLDGEVIENEFEPNIEKWKRYWVIPLWIGVGITILGSLLMLWVYQSSGFSFWFACTWLPFLIGVALIAMAWGSRSARWLHLRVQQEPGEWPQTIAFSFPLPLNFAAWFMRTFGQFIPEVNKYGLDFDQIIKSFADSTTPETPFYVEVDEGDHGEKVQIYIG